MSGTASHGTLLQRAQPLVTAHLHTGVIGNNNAVLWTAVSEVAATGALVTVELINPGGAGSLSITVTGNDIAVTLAHSGAAITTTAAQLIAAINGNAAASALVSASNDGASTGAGLVVAVTPHEHLANGDNTVTYTTIAEVKDISGPNFSRGTVDVTSHSSASGWKEFVIGQKENGEVTFSVNFTPTGTTHGLPLGLVKDYHRGILRNWRMIFPDTGGTVWDFSGYITSLGVTEPVEGVLGANITVKLSGAPTLA